MKNIGPPSAPLLILICLWLILLGPGCRKKKRPAPPPVPAVVSTMPSQESEEAPPPVVDQPVEVVDIDPIETNVSPAELADSAFDSGDYNTASTIYESMIDSDWNGPEVWFKLALSYLLSEERPEWERIANLLEDYVSHDGGAYRVQARAILLLLAENQESRTRLRESRSRANQLASELKKLKEIDLRRRP